MNVCIRTASNTRPIVVLGVVVVKKVSIVVSLFFTLVRGAPDVSLALSRSLCRPVSLSASLLLSLSRSLSQPNKTLSHSLYVWQSMIHNKNIYKNNKPM